MHMRYNLRYAWYTDHTRMWRWAHTWLKHYLPTGFSAMASSPVSNTNLSIPVNTFTYSDQLFRRYPVGVFPELRREVLMGTLQNKLQSLKNIQRQKEKLLQSFHEEKQGESKIWGVSSASSCRYGQVEENASALLLLCTMWLSVKEKLGGGRACVGGERENGRSLIESRRRRRRRKGDICPVPGRLSAGRHEKHERCSGNASIWASWTEHGDVSTQERGQVHSHVRGEIRTDGENRERERERWAPNRKSTNHCSCCLKRVTKLRRETECTQF